MNKRIVCILLSLMLLLASALGEGEDDVKKLQEKYEAGTAFTAAQTICRVGTDELSKWACDRAVKRPSAAWERISKFDSGWFSDIRVHHNLVDFGSGLTEAAAECYNADSIQFAE